MKTIYRSEDRKFESANKNEVEKYEADLTPFSYFGLPVKISPLNRERIIKDDGVGLSTQDAIVIVTVFNLVEDIYRFVATEGVRTEGGTALLKRLDAAAQGRRL
jgi:hypothetical protein